MRGFLLYVQIVQMIISIALIVIILVQAKGSGGLEASLAARVACITPGAAWKGHCSTSRLGWRLPFSSSPLSACWLPEQRVHLSRLSSQGCSPADGAGEHPSACTRGAT